MRDGPEEAEAKMSQGGFRSVLPLGKFNRGRDHGNDGYDGREAQATQREIDGAFRRNDRTEQHNDAGGKGDAQYFPYAPGLPFGSGRLRPRGWFGFLYVVILRK